VSCRVAGGVGSDGSGSGIVLRVSGRRKGVPGLDCVGAGVHINLDLLIPALDASKVLGAC
jgi:hypothetical protein